MSNSELQSYLYFYLENPRLIHASHMKTKETIVLVLLSRSYISFSDLIIIEYNLKNEVTVEISIFNILGQK
jgi:hypothetical protein